jgi:2-polyprenyl-3-methyl-5-hydroxy-6-metoxy-1,4-benzoquinol methylase
MSRRSLDTHGAFVRPLLRADMAILDLGCGPGTLTLDLARQVPLGHVLGVDLAESQLSVARDAAVAAGIGNVEFRVGEAGRLGLDANRFDLLFSHALFEHLSEPVGVLQRLRPLLRPGGHIALRSPDFGGWVLYPDQRDSADAIEAYGSLQTANGGDTHAGRKLGAWLAEAGFTKVRRSANYEIYPSAALIAGYLAGQLDSAGLARHAVSLHTWSQMPGAFFAQSWFEAVAEAP